jgi:hypothetical protein
MKLAAMFKDLEKQIKKTVQAAITDTLENEVFEVIKEVILNRAQNDVYDVYSPRVYRRRRSSQGLLDENNIVYDLEKNGQTLVVWNIAKFNPNNNPHAAFSTEKRKHNILQKLIIDGWSKVQPDDPAYMHPRPFIANANKDLRRGGDHRKSLESAFEEGLARHGITKKS